MKIPNFCIFIREKERLSMITAKQRAFLRGLANGIPAVLQIGKEGVNENIIQNLAQALEARELVKVSVLETSPVSSKEAVALALAAIPGCEPVQVIGRRFVVYKRNLKEPKLVLNG